MSTALGNLKNAFHRLVKSFGRLAELKDKLYLDGLGKDSIILNLRSQIDFSPA
jgi:hypothetical protein